ncbi:MAG TPA: HAMP domain-containing sensor histidine kinase, partial [Aggregicoccus sp.]|nr:HAMP domain-containing sensor histidine kinase [Aggregicoccus sp.]
MTLVLLAGAAAGPGASALERLLLGAWYMPHGHCYLWKPALVWLHVVSDLLIGAAYVLISVVLYALVRRIRLPFSGVIVAFGLFIGACGLTHFMEVWNTWYSAYWLAGGVKAVTAAASVATGVLLVRLRPTVVAVASAAQLSEQRREALEQKNRELEALYARLREADAHKTQFFANVSHELRTPLSLILGPVERLLTHDVSAAEQRADLQVVERNAQLLLRHVNALLDSAKLEAGQLRPDYAQVDLAELLRRVASNFELLSRERQVPLEVVAPQALPAQVDAEKMERVLLNLLSNAFKFTPPGGRVRCVLEESGEGAWLAVEDSGPGVPESAREAIFERFRQAAAEGEVPQGGTGLGLAIARDFVQLHAGTLHVEGGALGGARFVTQLPLMAPGGAPVRPWPQRTTQASVAEARAATQL